MIHPGSDFDTAVAAYRTHCEANGAVCEDASTEHSEVINGIVYLRSKPTGFIARYSIGRGRLLS